MMVDKKPQVSRAGGERAAFIEPKFNDHFEIMQHLCFVFMFFLEMEYFKYICYASNKVKHVSTL